ncbi:MAG TPA: pilus assembly protein TadG-related protein [Streptosporangiaceae bacterium]|nr:pilus assembly protein TadG-related protein [Streptosporangiaceae bacterium]
MRDLMASLTRLILLRLRREERGAVGVIVAILIGAGVLTGMGALVIDVGQLFQERGELQDGTDAAALGVAKSCALGSCTPAVAVQLADANASSLTGGTASVDLVCGSGALGLCPASTGTFTSCPSAPPGGTNYVEVNTSALTPPAFGSSSTTVRACAQAEWGPPAAATTAAIAISACEWDQATQQGALFGPGPGGGPPAASFDQLLTTADLGKGGGCATEPAVDDPARTFGWVAHPRGNCTLQVSGGSFTGRGTWGRFSCQAVLQNAWQSQVPILVPVYTTFGANTYGLQGFADFVVTGYNLPRVSQAQDLLDPANTCPATDTETCLSGYFVQGLIPTTGSITTGPGLGASVIDLTG